LRFTKDDDNQDTEANMAPMIDVIFQLVLFFVFSMKFIAFEGQLQAYLPKDRGQSAPQTTLDPTTATLYLEWEPDGGGEVLCRTLKYVSPEGKTFENFTFPRDDDDIKEDTGPDGTIRVETHTLMRGRKGDEYKVTYDYLAPRFDLVEEHLRERKDTYDRRGVGAGGLPVSVNFEDPVPWQAIANVLDICVRLEITNIALNILEIES
jgi:hypothetical protein